MKKTLVLSAILLASSFASAASEKVCGVLQLEGDKLTLVNSEEYLEVIGDGLAMNKKIVAAHGGSMNVCTKGTVNAERTTIMAVYFDVQK